MDAYLGQIVAVAFDWVPKGWMACDGSLLQAADHQDLFTLISCTYGGDFPNTFRLPDLRGRVAVCQGEGFGQPSYPLGETGGVEGVVLTSNQLGAHSHALMASASTGTVSSPNQMTLAVNPQTAVRMYGTGTPDVTLAGNAIQFSSNTAKPHENRQPFAVINYIICVSGPYPRQF
jgi:microcystin-dependent protein